MDTFQIFESYASQANVVSALNSRYSGCTSLNNGLSNLWANYYNIKTASLNGVKSRITTAQGSVTTLTGYIAVNLTSLFNTVKSNLLGTLSTVTDPKYGLIAGLNCRVFGEDIVRITNAFCVSIFNSFYITRLVLGIASYGILFSLCCIVCSGVRHYKHG
jgi:hypothetical protein